MIKRINLKNWTIPLALLVIVVLAYGVLIPWLGFYWDDLPYLWQAHVNGPSGYPAFVASDRPFSGWIFMATTWAFGETAWLYHLFALLLRWAVVLGAWWVVKLVWQDQKRLALWVAILFAVYPGFKQQPIALIYNHHLSVLALYFLSVALMLWAARGAKRSGLLIALSALCSLSIFSIEYFVGLELLRPVFLWLVLKDRYPLFKQRLAKTSLYWLPTLLVLVIFGIWRVFIFKFPTYQLVSSAQSSNLQLISGLLGRVFADIFKVTFTAWAATLKLPTGLFSILLYAALVAFTAIFTFVYLANVKNEVAFATKPETNNLWAKQAVLVGLFAILLAGVPVWATNLPITLEFMMDRLTMAFMFGVSLVIVGLLEWFIHPHPQRLIILSALVCLSIGLHFQNATAYRRDYDAFKNFWWQIIWRVPALEPGTSIVTQNIPLTYYSDNSLAAPLNWLYTPNPAQNLDYMFFDLAMRPDLMNAMQISGGDLDQFYRTFSFDGNSDDLLVIYQKPPACLKVIDATRDVGYANAPSLLEKILNRSDIDNIIINAEPLTVNTNIFGAEPAHNWCYYYQKAELARQAGDWQEVARLGDAAWQAGDKPNAWLERLPFIEGYAHVGEWDKAQQLTHEIAAEQSIQTMICALWQRVETSMTLSEAEAKIVNDMQAMLECTYISE